MNSKTVMETNSDESPLRICGMISHRKVMSVVVASQI